MPTQDKVLRILITAKDESAMRKLLLEKQLDLSCGGPKRLESGAIVVEAYVSEQEVERLKKYGVKIDVLGDESEALRARQKEVGKGNRFQGKERVPKGLGRKVKGD